MSSLIKNIKLNLKFPAENLLLFLLVIAIFVASYFIVTTFLIEGFEGSYICSDGYTFSPTTGTLPTNWCVKKTDVPASCASGSINTGTAAAPVCSACPTNSTQTGNTCVCNSGFINTSTSTTNPTCQACPANSKASGNTCSCNTGYLNKNIGTDSTTNPTCEACPTNQVILNNKCVCASGFRNTGTEAVPVCVACPANSVGAGLGSTSTCTCNTGLLNNLTAGGTSTNPKCVACNTNSTQVTGSSVCTCNNNFVPVGGDATVPVCSACPSNSTFASTATGATCSCNSNYVNNGGTSVAPVCATCPANSVISGSNCVCDSSSIKTGGTSTAPICAKCAANQFTTTGSSTCTTCPANSTLNSTSSGCTCTAPYVNTGTNVNIPTCTCPANSTINTAKTACVCNTGYLNKGTTAVPICEACPANSVPNANGTACVCASGYTNRSTTSTVRCVENCIVQQNTLWPALAVRVWEYENGKDVCKFNTSKNYDVCNTAGARPTRRFGTPQTDSRGYYVDETTGTINALPNLTYYTSSNGTGTYTGKQPLPNACLHLSYYTNDFTWYAQDGLIPNTEGKTYDTRVTAKSGTPNIPGWPNPQPKNDHSVPLGGSCAVNADCIDKWTSGSNIGKNRYTSCVNNFCAIGVDGTREIS